MKLAVINNELAIVTPEHGCYYPTAEIAKLAGTPLLGQNNIDIAMDGALLNRMYDALESPEASAFSKSLDDVVYDLPIPVPPSFRDAYAFLTHVKTCREARGQEVPQIFYECPAFYFSNPAVMKGEGPVKVGPYQQDKLDYELEVAVVMGKDVEDISVADADQAIAGMMLLNDWSARKIQAERELPMMMGPNKSKDFATTAGPWLVTKAELAPYITETPEGNHYDIDIRALVNGTPLSGGNVNSIHYTFAQIIHHIAKGTIVKKGDVIGSGTVGGGCMLELNLTKQLDNQWLKDGDVVELDSEILGSLTNTVVYK
tara:strand:+ start:481230 stop:482174 length:945 start_codon:yes stop_codon:yes gene_type:complete